ncbi:MAG: TolB family protein [Bacillota bacterium]
MRFMRFITLGLLIALTFVGAAEKLKVKEIHNLFSDDIGEREDILYQAMGVMGGFFDNASWSPDGTKIAFDFSAYDEPSSIWLVNPDGTGLKKISGENDEDPSWSPDGTQIVVAHFSLETEQHELWIMNADGTNRRFLTIGFEPSWSSTNKIAFVRREEPQGTDIWVINPDGTGLTRLTNTPEDEYCPAWSPDGRKIAFDRYKDGRSDIWTMNADGTNQMQLTTKEGQRPSWSPDGKWIAFESSRWRNTGDIWAVRADKVEEVVHLKTGAETAGGPAWSPDGKKILFGAVYKFKVDDGLFLMTLR